MRKQLLWTAALAAAVFSLPARAQSQPAAQASSGGPQVRAEDCIALMDGRVPAGQDAGRLRVACENLLRSTATVQPGIAQNPAPAGESVQASFTQAGKELVGQRPTGLGATTRGPVTSTLMTNPLGWFSGLGVNVSYERPFDSFDKLSWVALASFSRTSTSNGNASTAGLGGGVDFFVIGHDNEGLRIGPRLSTYFGTETIQGSTTFARLGASAEVGYNHIASNGITGSVALGFGGRLAGDAKNDNFAAFTGGQTGLYVTAGVGYSW